MVTRPDLVLVPATVFSSLPTAGADDGAAPLADFLVDAALVAFGLAAAADFFGAAAFFVVVEADFFGAADCGNSEHEMQQSLMSDN